jgi:hypothetical protein
MAVLCTSGLDVQLLALPGRFRAGSRLDAKNVKMRSVDLVFTE